MRAYLLAYNPVIPSEAVHRVLNGTHAVDTWLAPFPNALLVLSRLTVSELAAVLHTHFAGVWFVLVEATKDNANGWLPPQFWEYISDPDSALSKKLLAQMLTETPPPPEPPGLGNLLLGNWERDKRK